MELISYILAYCLFQLYSTQFAYLAHLGCFKKKIQMPGFPQTFGARVCRAVVSVGSLSKEIWEMRRKSFLWAVVVAEI